MNNNVDNNHRDEGIISFYPGIIPAEEGHPTSAKFIVVETGDERGRGLKSKAGIVSVAKRLKRVHSDVFCVWPVWPSKILPKEETEKWMQRNLKGARQGTRFKPLSVSPMGDHRCYSLHPTPTPI